MKLHLCVNGRGEILACQITPGKFNRLLGHCCWKGQLVYHKLDPSRLGQGLTSRSYTLEEQLPIEELAFLPSTSVSYARDSLNVYGNFREKAKTLIMVLKQQGVHDLYLNCDDEIMNILRLTSIESCLQKPCNFDIRKIMEQYQKIMQSVVNGN